nr:MAG TPA: RNA dependent RNA polymerase [Bacteriophage sp.]
MRKERTTMANYSANDVRNFLVNNHELLNDHLEHYGLPRRSGRYKWGSGKDPYQSLRSSAKAGEKFIKSFSKKSGVEKQNVKRRERTKAAQIEKKKQKTKYRNEKAYVKTLSDEELRRINARDSMEATYLKNHPQKQPLPKKLVDKAVKDIIVPAVTEVVKEQGKVYIKGKLNAAAQKMINEAVKAETKKTKKNK